MSGYGIAMATGAALMCATAVMAVSLIVTILTDPVGLAVSATSGNLADVVTAIAQQAFGQLW